jgi:hypothetical protein
MASLKLATLFTALKDAGVTSVEIRYDGGGDSGQVDDVEFFGDNLDGADLNDRFEGDLQDLAYSILQDHYNYDWYNNDGGYGTVVISFDDEEPTINVDGYVRELTDAFSSVNLVNIEWGE